MMRDRKVLILAGVGGLLAVFALLFLFVLGGGDSEPQADPPTGSTTSGQAKTSEDDLDVAEVTPDLGSPRVFGVSSRDPFTPQVRPTPDAGGTADSSSSSSQDRSSKKSTSKATGSDSRTTKTSKSTQNTKITKNGQNPSGSETGESTKTSDKPKNKAPVPIGAGKKANPDGDRTELAVVEVRDTSAVVRINNARTTLFLTVPDPSGVTYVASLGGGCGWFTVTGAEQRLSICEGETRQM